MQRKANNSMLRRLMFVGAMLGVVCFVVIAVRLFQLQVMDYEFYQQKALSQQTRDKTIYPTRGTIYDCNNKPLAISASTEMVTIEAVKIEDEEQGELVAQEMSRILGLEYEDVLAKVNKKSTYDVLKRGVEKEVADQVRAFKKANPKITAVYLAPDSTRYYPFGNFLSHVLGFVGSDEQGLAGLEAQYDKVLTGTPGRIVTATNVRGDEMPFQYEMYYDAIDGNNLVLTIDEVVQHYLEKNLEIALYDNKVQNKVTGIIMDVNTGGILAMATKPDFDPNSPFVLADEEEKARIDALTDAEERKKARSDALNEQWRIRAISDSYDPGSTFKILTAAMALEEKVVDKNTHFNCVGFKMIEGWSQKIKCWKYPNAHGDQTLEKAIQNSCNPAFMEIGSRVGIEKFQQYFKAFGLGERTGIDLPGETGSIFFQTMTNVDLAVASFGQNFQITPIQLLTAVSAVANGGTLVRPHLVKEIVDQDGNVIESFDRQEVRQVISKETSAELCEILESVVTEGTGKNAYVMGYRVAGKTGTSEKKAKIAQTGDNSLRIASFIAFAPADDPQIAVLIVLDEPTVVPVTGGITAAPVVRRIMEDVLPYLNVEPIYTEQELEKKDIIIPGQVGRSRAEAETALKNAGINYRTVGKGDTVTDQIPAEGATVSSNAQVVLYMGQEKPQNMVTVPDLSRMSVDQTRKTLQNIGLYMQTSGAISTSGGSLKVLRQSVAPGEKVPVGTVLVVEFSDLNQLAQ